MISTKQLHTVLESRFKAERDKLRPYLTVKAEHRNQNWHFYFCLVHIEYEVFSGIQIKILSGK